MAHIEPSVVGVRVGIPVRFLFVFDFQKVDYE